MKLFYEKNGSKPIEVTPSRAKKSKRSQTRQSIAEDENVTDEASQNVQRGLSFDKKWFEKEKRLIFQQTSQEMMKQLNLAAIKTNDVMKMLKDESKKLIVFEQDKLKKVMEQHQNSLQIEVKKLAKKEVEAQLEKRLEKFEKACSDKYMKKVQEELSSLKAVVAKITSKAPATEETASSENVESSDVNLDISGGADGVIVSDGENEPACEEQTSEVGEENTAGEETSTQSAPDSDEKEEVNMSTTESEQAEDTKEDSEMAADTNEDSELAEDNEMAVDPNEEGKLIEDTNEDSEMAEDANEDSKLAEDTKEADASLETLETSNANSSPIFSIEDKHPSHEKIAEKENANEVESVAAEKKCPDEVDNRPVLTKNRTLEWREKNKITLTNESLQNEGCNKPRKTFNAPNDASMQEENMSSLSADANEASLHEDKHDEGVTKDDEVSGLPQALSADETSLHEDKHDEGMIVTKDDDVSGLPQALSADEELTNQSADEEMTNQSADDEPTNQSSRDGQKCYDDAADALEEIVQLAEAACQ